jgi:type VI secretion system secreted protein VgrG
MNSILDLILAGGDLAFTQRGRLLRLRFAAGSGVVPEILQAHRISGEERLSASYRYQLDCLSPDIHLELKDYLGQPVEVALRLADGGERLLCGIVSGAEQQGADGGFAHYRLRIEPALQALALRRNSRVFQDQSVPAIVAAILDEHRAANPVIARSFRHRAELSMTYPPRAYTVQYRESDLAFIERLLAEEGISYRYQHGAEPAGSNRAAAPESAETPQHTLVLFDANDGLSACDPLHVRFHRTDGGGSEDAIDDWQGQRAIQPGQTQFASYDAWSVTTDTGAAASGISGGEGVAGLTSTLQDYDPQTERYGDGPDALATYARRRQQTYDLEAKTFHGQGSARSLTPGSWFELRGHPIHDHDGIEDRQFLITGLAFEAQNNLVPELGRALSGLLARGDDAAAERPPYRNSFTAVRRSVPLRPSTGSRHQKPTAPGSTTAIVVGPAGEEIYTDEHGRVRIQFHWQRPKDHPAGGAAFDERSSVWVRVASPSAGAGWGSQYLPRVGQEVLVTFIEHDLDRPLVSGVVYNGSHRPSAFSGAGSLPANRALSGHQSKEVGGNRANELLFDDTSGQLRARLASAHGQTQLNQGYLIEPRTDGKGEARGEGFELRTDQAGALRAAKGVLLTAWQRVSAAGPQLSRNETQGLMDDCLALFKQLGDYAASHQGLAIDATAQQQLNQACKDWESGSNTASAGGQGATPQIAITTPGGIHQTTPASQASYAGKNFDLVAGQHLQQTAGQRATLNAGQGIGLFAHDGGLKAIAHHGPLLLQSQHDDTTINAAKNLTITASQGRITLQAQGDIVSVVSGGAYFKLQGGNVEVGGPGAFSAKAASHQWVGPAKMGAVVPSSSFHL